MSATWVVLLVLLLTMLDATVLITSPIVTLFPNNTLPYYYANFGEVPYGKSLRFNLVVPESSLCDNITGMKHLQTPSYVLVLDNFTVNCSQTHLALNAQIIGAKGVLIGSELINYAEGDIVHADDGNGKIISITCLFISKENYTNLVNLKDVQLSVNFAAKRTPVAKIVYYLSAVNRLNYVFLRQFRPYYNNLQQSVTLEPVYYTMECSSCQLSNCILDFCAFDTENGQEGVGSLILREQLIQYNVFRYKGVDLWFDYMSEFDRYCDDNWYAAEACSKNVLLRLGISDVLVGMDMVSVLAEWRSKLKKIGLSYVPEVSVNNLLYSGNFEGKDVAEMACASISNPPDACSGDAGADRQQQKGWLIAGVVGVSVCVTLGLGICLYRRLITKELTDDMSSKVNELVAKYATKVSEQSRKRKNRLIESMHEQL